MTVRNVDTKETKEFVKEMKEKYKTLDSCKFTTRSGHFFGVAYVFSSEKEEKLSQEVIVDTKAFLKKNSDIITGSEIGIDFIFTDESQYSFNLEDIDEPEKWIYSD